VSGVAAALRRPAAPEAARPLVRAESQLVSLAAFAALAAFCAAHWAVLLEEPLAGRTASVVAIAAVLAAALAAAGRGASFVRNTLRAPLVLVALGAGLLTAGLPARLLAPGRWDAVADGVDRGLTALSTSDWPYAGTESWARLTLMLALPLVLTAAATLAFWPRRESHRAAGRIGALVLLLTLYGTATTLGEFDAELLRGAGLLVLVAAWLWGPRLRRTDAAAAAGAVAAVAVLALPVASGLDGPKPWIDYRSWEWVGAGGLAFDWEQAYGPMSWSRDGRTVLDVKSPRAHYWKAETLDSFDGFRWTSSRSYAGQSAGARLPEPLNPRWFERIEVSVRNLRTKLVVGAGTPYRVEGLHATAQSGDGTVSVLGDPLERGDAYTVRAYVPDPSAEAMRAAGDVRDTALLEQTAISLPSSRESPADAPDPVRSADFRGRRVSVGLRGLPGTATPGTAAAMRASPYAGVYRLSRRLAASAPTTYDLVRRIEDFLKRRYSYSESPPPHRFALPAFLFEDKTGYCQHFSGAMALMLRMNGVPTRVAAGFTPGSYDRDSREYKVRDLDAHDWVEVYFAGIGWVPFDPTPPVAPAESQSSAGSAASAAVGDASDGSSPDSRSLGEGRAAQQGSEHAGDRPGPLAGRDDSALPVWTIAAAAAGLAAVAGLAVLGLGALERRRRWARDPEGEQLRDLRATLERLGYAMSRRTTLLGLERRLGLIAGEDAARYVRSLRERRFGGAAAPPGRAERRALRRALIARLGPLGRLRAVAVLRRV
jgi:transglutaminase-like putative cysteine protease